MTSTRCKLTVAKLAQQRGFAECIAALAPSAAAAAAAAEPNAEVSCKDVRGSGFVKNLGCVGALFATVVSDWTRWQERRRTYAAAQQSSTITSGAEARLCMFDGATLKQADARVLTCAADALQSSVTARDAARAAAVEPLTQSVTSHLALIQALDQERKVLSSLVGADARPAATVTHGSKPMAQVVSDMYSFALSKWASLQKLHGAICKLEQQIRDGVDGVFAGAGTATPASRGLFSLADELEAMQRERDSLLQSVGHLCKRFFMLLPV